MTEHKEWGERPVNNHRKPKSRVKVVFVTIGGLLVAFLALAIALGGSSGDSPHKEHPKPAQTHEKSSPPPLQGTKNHPAKKDLHPVKIKSEGYGFYSATIDITNHSSKSSDYDVKIAYMNAEGKRIGTDDAFETDVKPGLTVTSQLMGPEHRPAETEILKVERTESFG